MQIVQTPLCVAMPVFGQRSETFIRKHVCAVAPDRTAILSSFALPTARQDWEFQGPQLSIDPDQRILRGVVKLIRANISQAGTEREIIRFLKVHGVKAIVVEYLDSFLPFAQPIMDAGIRWYSFGHGYDVSERLLHESWRQKYQIHDKVNGVFVRAHCIRERLISIGLRADNIHVVRGGVEVPSVCRRLPNNETINLLAVGRMVPKKGPILTLKAFHLAAIANPKLHFNYIGEGPLFEDAKAYVAKNGLADRVTLHGGQPSGRVMELLQNTDIFVQHSIKDPDSGDEEGLPAAITEAMAHAIPVVSTFHAGIPEAVLDGKTGFLVKEGDIEGMATKISCLAESYDLRKTLGIAGWEWAREEFSWEGERKRILELTGLANEVQE